MAIFMEDWGSTLGTAGNGAWVQYAGDKFGTVRRWAVDSGALLSPDSSGTAANSMTQVIDWTGSQTHILQYRSLSPVRFISRASGMSDGTSYWWESYNSLTVGAFRLMKRTTAWSCVASATMTVRGSGITGTMTGFYQSGTLIGTWTCGTETLTISAGIGTAYAPGTSILPAIGFRQTDGTVAVLTSTWEYNAPTILRFIGTWATGSGTYEWGGDVLGYPGDVQDRAYGPDDTAGWASTVGVTIDNSAGQWGSFAGTGQLPFEGLWNLRQYWSSIGTVNAGSWVDLFTGYLEPDGVSFDYGRSQVRLTLQSTIARAAQSIALLDGTALSVPGPGGLDVPCRQRLLGSIAAVDPDTGTARIGNVAFSPWEAETGCLLWGTSGTSSQSIKIGSSITALGAVIPGGTGTVVLEGDIPPWMTIGAPAWITRAWPNYRARSGGYHPWTYVKSLIDGMPGLTWPADDMAIFYKQSGYSNISPNDRLYGGEKLTTALSGIMRAINGFYSVDPLGNFRARCLLPTVSVAGTVDFNAAYDSDWQMSYEPAYSRVEVDCSYNVEARSFTEHVSVGGTQAWGEVKKYELKWLGSGIEAQSMAGRLYRNAYLPRPSLTLRLAGSSWADYQPGNVYAIHNLPAQLGAVLAGTNMICYSRTYSWADDLTAMEFVALPGGNYAVWDGTPADYWEGSGKVWY